jgi:hypothetical protein
MDNNWTENQIRVRSQELAVRRLNTQRKTRGGEHEADSVDPVKWA